MKYINTIETNRLLLTKPSLEDINEFYESFTESFTELNQYFSPAWAKYDNCPQKTEIEKFINNAISDFQNNNSYLFIVRLKGTNQLIGHGEVHHYDPSVPKGRLGFWVRTDLGGNGYATEIANALTQYCFEKLSLQRLEIRNDIRNPASGMIAKKLGYRYLTVFEKNKQGKKSDYWDLEIYDRLNLDGLPDLDIKYHYDES